METRECEMLEVTPPDDHGSSPPLLKCESRNNVDG